MIRVTQLFGNNSKNAQYMHYDYEHAHGTIWSRYERPSQNKVDAWNDIVSLYNSNIGVHSVKIKGVEHTLQYNYDVKMVGASSHFFSTIASFEDLDDGKTYLIKETHCNTYMCEL